jgi:hypothetical protein
MIIEQKGNAWELSAAGVSISNLKTRAVSARWFWNRQTAPDGNKSAEPYLGRNIEQFSAKE